MIQGQTDDRLSAEITSAVANREDVDELELPEPLYETIDAEALANLFQDGSGRVTFDYLSYKVIVDHEQNIDVVSPEGS